MASPSLSSLLSAIIFSVCANVLTVFTVSVRSFRFPFNSKCPSDELYFTFARLRTGIRIFGFRCAMILA